jgi:hypothetical protein
MHTIFANNAYDALYIVVVHVRVRYHGTSSPLRTLTINFVQASN